MSGGIMGEITSQNVRVAWAEFSVLYKTFSEAAENIARRKYPKGIISIEFDFENGDAVASIYYSQNEDFLRISLTELENELSNE